MKILKLIIKNIGLVKAEEIPINQPLIIFYGTVCAGKSTILNSVKWVCGGEFPSDILTHGAKDGDIELQFTNGHLRREFYLAKDGKTVKARPIEFIRDNRPVDKPVREIEKLLNPFTLDQDFLVRKNEADRKKYFIDLFGVETSDIDTSLTSLESEASALRSELKGYGEIDLTEQKPVDVAVLKQERVEIVSKASFERSELEAQLASINQSHEQKLSEWRKTCAVNVLLRLNRASKTTEVESVKQQINELQARIRLLEKQADDANAWLKVNADVFDPREPVAPDTALLKTQILVLHSPDTAAVDAALSNAAAQNVRAEQYQKNLAREQERLGKCGKLDETEKSIKAKREEKLTRLKSINESCKIEGLKFGDDGDFVFEGTTAMMLSTSQLMRLSAKLSDLYPPGLGLELIDRGESLGKSIFDLIKRAKDDERTILATVVGDKPAIVPEQVGVYVVENGKVSP